MGEKWDVSHDEEDEFPPFSVTNLVGEGTRKKKCKAIFSHRIP